MFAQNAWDEGGNILLRCKSELEKRKLSNAVNNVSGDSIYCHFIMQIHHKGFSCCTYILVMMTQWNRFTNYNAE